MQPMPMFGWSESRKNWPLSGVSMAIILSGPHAPQPGHLNVSEKLYQIPEIKCVIRSRQTHAGPK